MPIPTFHFENPSLGLPRQPVPVRFACFAANWSIGMLATVLSREDAFNGQLLSAYEFIAELKYKGEVAPGFYDQFRGLDSPTPETLAAIPANHFVWSDDLTWAYSEFVDLAWSRDDAHAAAAGVRWAPALGDCAKVVSQSVDLSQLSPCNIDAASSYNRIYCVKDIWTFEFMGSTVQVNNSVGIRYLNHLMTHPFEELSAVDLYRLINPPPALDSSFRSTSEAVESLDHDDDSSGYEGSHGGAHDSVYDDKTKTSIATKCKRLREQIKELREQKKYEEAARLEDEEDELLKYLREATSLKGNPRSFNHDNEKARKAVWSARARAIQQIKKLYPDLGKYLDEKIKTGHSCRFMGDAWLNSPGQRT